MADHNPHFGQREYRPGGTQPSLFSAGVQQTRLLILVVFVGLVLVLLWHALTVLLLLFAGALVALGLRFLGDGLSRITRIPPRWSLSIVLFLIITGSGIAFSFAAPAAWEQFREFTEGVEGSVKHLEDTLREMEWGKWLLDRLSRPEDLTGDLSELWPDIAGVFGTTFGAIAGFFLTLVVGVFLAYNPELYLAGLLRLIPQEKRARASEVLFELGHTLRWWIVGQLISMLMLFATTWLMLWLLGVPLAFPLALLTGLLTFVPYLGPTIAAIPILLIAFVESPFLALWVLALYLVIQNVEANVLMPIIFSKTVHLPPVLTVIAQLLLGGMLGFVGILLATPLMAAAMVVVKMVYVEDVIGDDFNRPVKELPG